MQLFNSETCNPPFRISRQSCKVTGSVAVRALVWVSLHIAQALFVGTRSGDGDHGAEAAAPYLAIAWATLYLILGNAAFSQRAQE